MTNETDELEQSFSAMEYFILALIAKAQLTSLYDLQQKASLQPGGIRPAIQRLEDAGLLERAESSKRRRRDFSLTKFGRNVLNNTWRRSLREYPDSESVLRGACIALLMGEPQLAAEYLIGISIGRKNAAEEKNMEAERLGTRRRDPLSAYAWMRGLTEAQRREAESEAFSKLGRALKEKHQPDVVEPN